MKTRYRFFTIITIALMVLVLTLPTSQAQEKDVITDTLHPNSGDNPNASPEEPSVTTINNDDYTLGAEDVINITILRHPEVSGEFIITKNGAIQYEFVGDIQVAGLTKDEVAELLKEKLSKFIITPDVTVKIVGYNSKVVYVIGEVGNPGKIYMRGDTITVREALIQAGLPLLSAKLTKTMLITPSDSGHTDQIMVDLDKLLYKGDLRENFEMKPGDTLYLPPTFFAKALRVIQPVAAPIGTAAGTGRTVTGTGF